EVVVGPLELRLQPLVILDHEQFRFGLGHHATSGFRVCIACNRLSVAASGSRMKKRVPNPSRDSTSSWPPIARTSSRASNAPMPKPPGFDEWNGLNRRVRTN